MTSGNQDRPPLFVFLVTKGENSGGGGEEVLAAHWKQESADARVEFEKGLDGADWWYFRVEKIEVKP